MRKIIAEAMDLDMSDPMAAVEWFTLETKEQEPMSRIPENDCLPECDVNAFDQTNNRKLNAYRSAFHDIWQRLEQLNDEIAQHQDAIVLLERQRDRLLSQVNEDVPLPADQG